MTGSTWARAGATVWLVTSLLACGEHQVPAVAAGAAGAVTDLATQTLAPTQIAEEVEFDGRVEAINRATVSAQTTGRVQTLGFDVGDLVAKGATLVELTDTEQQAAVNAGESAVTEAKVRFAEAERNFERAQAVFAKKLISRADFDQASTEFEAARARLERAQAELEAASEALGYTRITAPYAGIVLERHVQVGETVAPGQALYSGLSLEQLRVVVNVPVAQIEALRTHREAHVALPDGRTLEATQLRFAPAADVATQTFEVLVGLPEGAWGVSPGTLLKVRFVSGSHTRLLVPRTALVRRGELTGVYVLNQDRSLVLRYVRLGLPVGNERQHLPVLAGLAAGDTIVLNPAEAALRLQTGAR